MRSSSRPYAAVGTRQCTTVPIFVFALAVIAEFRRAVAATERYEQLRYTARARNRPAANLARRIYTEFYADW